MAMRLSHFTGVKRTSFLFSVFLAYLIDRFHCKYKYPISTTCFSKVELDQCCLCCSNRHSDGSRYHALGGMIYGVTRGILVLGPGGTRSVKSELSNHHYRRGPRAGTLHPSGSSTPVLFRM